MGQKIKSVEVESCKELTQKCSTSQQERAKELPVPEAQRLGHWVPLESVVPTLKARELRTLAARTTTSSSCCTSCRSLVPECRAGGNQVQGSQAPDLCF